MPNKPVKQLLYAEEIMMGDIPIRQPFPTNNISQIDPFLLLHHHKNDIQAGSHPRQAGVDPHPHRGFTPITFVLNGEIHHRDSRGNSEVVKAGGVQWLDAGRGIIHSERPGKSLAANGGALELIQLWVNTPQKYKMDVPRYVALAHENLPKVKTEKAETSIICGNYHGINGAVHTKFPMNIFLSTLVEEESINYNISKEHNALIYVVNGKVHLGGYGLIEAYHALYFENSLGEVQITALENTQLLVLSAMPINEPVVSHGPFVMNTQTEIMTAMRDYQLGKMGILIEEF